MNRYSVTMCAAAILALMALGMAVAVAGPPADEEPAPGAAALSLGEPGLSFRYVATYGVTEMAWLADVDHLNHPNGLGIDGADNLWVAEGDGFRVLKYDSAGTFQMSIGTAGLRTTLASPWDVGVDATGHIWVADSHAHRVVRFALSLIHI